jgi:CRP-like cAMP-binding protein
VLSPCEKACGFHRTILSNLMQIMARKNLAFHQKLQITSRRTTREKLLAYLNVQAKIHGSPSFSIPFDRQELADYLGVERSGLSTEIGRLRAEGILECRKNHFILLEKTP